MRYNVVKNASEIIDDSKILVRNPEKNIGNWSSVFGNNNPIMLELGMGRGSFIIQMAKKNPNVNYIGLELDINQTAYALKNIKGQRINNLSNTNLSIVQQLRIPINGNEENNNYIIYTVISKISYILI